MPNDKPQEPEQIESIDPRELAAKLVDKYATHEKTEVDDMSKKYELPQTDNDELPTFDKIENHFYRFMEFGYTYVSNDVKKSVARDELIDYLASEIESENLVLSSEITGSL